MERIKIYNPKTLLPAIQNLLNYWDSKKLNKTEQIIFNDILNSVSVIEED